ncbi:MAG TPA: hypothetical protein QF353_05405 [Gammaproteobacteria bacterium]|nr:hypothetical protein [Gammaproteobacteria bacterium]
MEASKNIFTRLFLNPWNGKSSLMYAFLGIAIVFTTVCETTVGNILFKTGLVEFTNHNYELISAPFVFYSSVCLWRCSKNSEYRVGRFFGRIFSMMISYFWVVPFITILVNYNIIDLSLIQNQGVIEYLH